MVRAFHTVIQCQLHRLARCLEFPLSGLKPLIVSWIRKNIPPKLFIEHPFVSLVYEEFQRVWFQDETVPFKSFLKMKFADYYRDVSFLH
jgi:hypothetical protein